MISREAISFVASVMQEERRIKTAKPVTMAQTKVVRFRYPGELFMVGNISFNDGERFLNYFSRTFTETMQFPAILTVALRLSEPTVAVVGCMFLAAVVSRALI